MSRPVESKLEGLHYQILLEWLESGKEDVLDSEMQEYLTILNKIYGWRFSLWTEGQILKALRKSYPNLTHISARSRYRDAINFFYSDKEISVESWRNLLVEDASRCYKAIIKTAKEPKDYLSAIRGIESVAKLLGLDKDQPEKIPEHILQEKTPILVLDPSKLDLPKVDRTILAEQIKNFNIPEADKSRIEQEAGITPFQIIKDNE